MIRFYNCRLLAMNGAVEVEDNKEVWVYRDTIMYVGPPSAEHPEFEQEIDLKGDLLMPGFKNAHAHSAMTFLRSYADDLPLQKWLFDKVFPYEAKLTPEDIYHLTRLGFLESIRSGITSSFEMYYHRKSIAQAGEDMGFRTVLCGGLARGDDITVAEQDIFTADRMSSLISYVPGVHSEYLADADILMGLSQLVESYELPFFAHNSETRKEYEECLERNELSPTQLFEQYGLFNYGGGGFHCVWFSEEDMEIFARRGLYAVTCPGSNSKLASGVAPITTFLKKKVPMAIGTDGPASNNALDMFREMYLVTVLQKLRDQDAAACDADRVLEMACCGGARAMNLPDCDCISFGKQADMIVLDLHQPNMQPLNNIAKNVVYSGSPLNVRMTIIAGKIVYEDGVYHVGDTPEEICRQAQKCTDRILRG